MSAQLTMEDAVTSLQQFAQIILEVSPVLAEMVLKEPLRRAVTLMNALIQVLTIVTS